MHPFLFFFYTDLDIRFKKNLQWSTLQSGSQMIDFNDCFCNDYFCILLLPWCFQSEQPGLVKTETVPMLWWKNMKVREANIEIIVAKMLINLLFAYQIEWEIHFASSKTNGYCSFTPLLGQSNLADCCFSFHQFCIYIYIFIWNYQYYIIQQNITGLHFMQTVILLSSLKL